MAFAPPALCFKTSSPSCTWEPLLKAEELVACRYEQRMVPTTVCQLDAIMCSAGLYTRMQLHVRLIVFLIFKCCSMCDIAMWTWPFGSCHMKTLTFF